MTTTDAWVDPDDYPEITSEQFDQADVKIGGKLVSRGGRPRGSDKDLVTLRLDRAALDRFKADGPGWQTRINDAVRRAAGLT